MEFDLGDIMGEDDGEEIIEAGDPSELEAWAAEQLAKPAPAAVTAATTPTAAGGHTFGVLDIETSPLDQPTLAALCPEFEPPEHPGEFDPSSVKCGNLGEAKANEKRAAARAAHETAVRDYDATCAAARVAHFQKFKDKAALSPLTGRVVAIGLGCGPSIEGAADVRILGSIDVNDATERAMLEEFWTTIQTWIDLKWPIVGHNSRAFDLPFLVMRSMYHGLDIPVDVVRLGGKFPQWHPLLIDTLEVCAFGRGGQAIKGLGLDAVGKFFGVGGKTEGCDGADFHRLWIEDHAKAVTYLTQDVLVTAAVAKKLLLI